jgi:hypothetical protein
MVRSCLESVQMVSSHRYVSLFELQQGTKPVNKMVKLYHILGRGIDVDELCIQVSARSWTIVSYFQVVNTRQRTKRSRHPGARSPGLVRSWFAKVMAPTRRWLEAV